MHAFPLHLFGRGIVSKVIAYEKLLLARDLTRVQLFVLLSFHVSMCKTQPSRGTLRAMLATSTACESLRDKGINTRSQSSVIEIRLPSDFHLHPVLSSSFPLFDKRVEDTTNVVTLEHSSYHRRLVKTKSKKIIASENWLARLSL
jgi:hypothetical protein